MSTFPDFTVLILMFWWLYSIVAHRRKIFSLVAALWSVCYFTETLTDLKWCVYWQRVSETNLISSLLDSPIRLIYRFINPEINLIVFKTPRMISLYLFKSIKEEQYSIIKLRFPRECVSLHQRSPEWCERASETNSLLQMVWVARQTHERRDSRLNESRTQVHTWHDGALGWAIWPQLRVDSYINTDKLLTV